MTGWPGRCAATRRPRSASNSRQRQATYRGSKTALSLVAFYADCRHEVLRVVSGYRITLTYNLLLHGDTSRPAGDEGAVAELADLLGEHFRTAAPRYHGGPATDPPNRLVYLLDHSYTARGLGWRRLKGADASRAALLRSAAGKAGCEALLALADVKLTHSAFPAVEAHGYRDGYGYRDWYGDSGEDEGEDDGPGDESGEYEVQELIDSEVTLTHWTGPDGTRLEETALHVHGHEVCASTPTGDLEPYSSQYEGYMGNWGNTLDRWYHRAAVIVWPGDRAFANRAETSPAWALDELAATASAGDAPGARAAAATLASFWDRAVRAQAATPAQAGTKEGRAGGLFGKALRAADQVADAGTAAMLLGPFRVENLTAAQAGSFGNVAGRYGQQWTARLLRTWFGSDRAAWAYGAGPDRQQWVADQLPGLCAELHGTGGAAAAAARRVLDLAWEWTGDQIGTVLALPSPGYRDKQLTDLGKPFAAVLTAAAAIRATGTRDAACEYIRKQGDAVTALELSALRAAKRLRAGLRAAALLREAAKPPQDGVRAAKLRQDGTPADAGFGGLAADCSARLRGRLARPQRAPGDWSIELPAGGCACELCTTLRAFLSDPGRRTFEWPLAQQRRQHIHSRIDTAELPVSHVTRRQGRPYTLVLSKTEALHAREREARIRDESDLQWLAAKWATGAAPERSGR